MRARSRWEFGKVTEDDSSLLKIMATGYFRSTFSSFLVRWQVGFVLVSNRRENISLVPMCMFYLRELNFKSRYVHTLV